MSSDAATPATSTGRIPAAQKAVRTSGAAASAAKGHPSRTPEAATPTAVGPLPSRRRDVAHARAYMENVLGRRAEESRRGDRGKQKETTEEAGAHSTNGDVFCTRPSQKEPCSFPLLWAWAHALLHDCMMTVVTLQSCGTSHFLSGMPLHNCPVTAGVVYHR